MNCPDFSQTGECPRGRSCPLRHFKKTRKRRSVSEDGEKRRTHEDTRRVVTATKEPSAFRRLRRALENKRIRLDGCDQTGSDHTSSIITPAQLEFIPLDTDTGNPCAQSKSQYPYWSFCVHFDSSTRFYCSIKEDT